MNNINLLFGRMKFRTKIEFICVKFEREKIIEDGPWNCFPFSNDDISGNVSWAT